MWKGKQSIHLEGLKLVVCKLDQSEFAEWLKIVSYLTLPFEVSLYVFMSY